MTTLLTVVLSVLATLAVIYLVWIGLGLRKAQKINGSVRADIEGLTHALEATREHFNHRFENEFDEIRKVVEFEIRGIREDHNDIRRNLHEAGDRFQRDQDRRFDRIYHKIYTKFPELKDIESPKEY